MDNVTIRDLRFLHSITVARGLETTSVYDSQLSANDSDSAYRLYRAGLLKRFINEDDAIYTAHQSDYEHILRFEPNFTVHLDLGNA